MSLLDDRTFCEFSATNRGASREAADASDSRQEYIETVCRDLGPDLSRQDTGNKVSRKSVRLRRCEPSPTRQTIAGSQNIILGGKTIIQTAAVIRGDLRRAGTGHAVVIAIGPCTAACLNNMHRQILPHRRGRRRAAAIQDLQGVRRRDTRS